MERELQKSERREKDYKENCRRKRKRRYIIEKQKQLKIRLRDI